MRHIFSLIVVAVALLATFGHICVLPTHVHAAPAAPDNSNEHHEADHSEPLDDGVHAASCEALRPGTATAATPMVAASTLAPTLHLWVSRSDLHRAGDAPVPTGSPPLYIVHRTLLI